MTASVPDSGTGATYSWAITNGVITNGSATRQVTAGTSAGTRPGAASQPPITDREADVRADRADLRLSAQVDSPWAAVLGKDLRLAAESKTYADEVKGIVNDCGLEITELSTHLQGQLVAVHPAYDDFFDGFAPKALRGNPKAKAS